MSVLYQGNALAVVGLSDGFVKLHFDNQNEAVNKFDRQTNEEFAQAVAVLEQNAKDIKGLLVTSGKSVFIAGADITEFVQYFQRPAAELESWLLDINAVFNRFEDLPFAKVALINGAALDRKSVV